MVSAVNVRKAGTLTVLRECLAYLSSQPERFRVTALVHQKNLCDYPGIEYVEIPWTVQSWGKRLWCEYVTMYRISRSFPEPADLWFSLHDTTPRVKARSQAVYCHTSFPFMKATWQDVKMDYKIALFSKLTRFAYKINIQRNRYLVVQQQWMREALSRMLRFDARRIVVSPPAFAALPVQGSPADIPETVFLYPATPDCHKNFETLCEASRMLEQQVGKGKFRTVLTLNGRENKYSAWLLEKFGDVTSLDFHGFLSREELGEWYGKASCLVFPSRIETWGLPISEFKITGKPMILADLAYARETAGGASRVAFFQPLDVESLADRMQEVLDGKWEAFSPVEIPEVKERFAPDWPSLFRILL